MTKKKNRYREYFVLITIASSMPSGITWRQSVNALITRGGMTEEELYNTALKNAISMLPKEWTWQGERPTVLFYRAVPND